MRSRYYERAGRVYVIEFSAVIDGKRRTLYSRGWRRRDALAAAKNRRGFFQGVRVTRRP